VDPRTVFAGAMPTCHYADCEQPWLRVEWGAFIASDGTTVHYATAVCEYGHRVPVEPTDPRDSCA
jgi:hypothetical protein